MSTKALGRVVRLRIKPQDCIAIQEICTRLGLQAGVISFSEGTSRALAALLEGARSSGTIPVSDGFDYLEKMAWFRQHEVLGNIPVENLPQDIPAERLQRQRRYEELKFLKEQSPENWTPEMQEEFKPLVEEFFTL